MQLNGGDMQHADAVYLDNAEGGAALELCSSPFLLAAHPLSLFSVQAVAVCLFGAR